MAWYNPKSWFVKPKRQEPVFEKEERGEFVGIDDCKYGARRFESADTNRLNRDFWAHAHSQSINVDLMESLLTLQARCSWEAAQNALVHGAIETLSCDIFGHEGPTLRVISNRNSFNDRVEGAWRDVWEMPDPNGRLSGVEGGHTWIRSLCTAGSFINIFSKTDRAGPVKFGWSSVHCRRLQTPVDRAGDPNTAFGHKLTDAGKPVEYYIQNHSRFGPGIFDASDFQTIPAGLVQHRYLAHEPEQLTGYPWLTPCLDTVSNLRQYDHFVMQAAKLAANSAQSLETMNPEFAVDPQDLTNVVVEWEPTSVNIAPFGWRWRDHTATQPSAEYTAFRHERLRELGLALGMPLMMVLLSSAESNFASAHYDGAVYMRRIKAIQHWLSLRTLKPLLQQVMTEMRMGGMGVPAKFKLMWSWPIPPYVNPEKQRKADRIALEDGIESVPGQIINSGGDPDKVLAERIEHAENMESNDLPPGPDFRAAAQLLQTQQGDRNEAVDDLDDNPRSRLDASNIITT